MVHRFVIGAVLVSALTSVGCGSADASSKDHDDSHPAWLVGDLFAENVTNAGERQSQTFVLNADGSAKEIERSIHPSVGVLVERPTMGKWALKGDRLTIGILTYTIHVGANCHLVQLDNRVFRHGAEGPVPGCQHLDPPLTSISLDDDRHMHMFVLAGGESGLDLMYSVDEGGTLHGTIPDGTEIITADVSASRSPAPADTQGRTLEEA